jgi:hypothetical protein
MGSGVNVPTRTEIRDICTAKSFRRGQDYYHEGRLRELSVDRLTGGPVDVEDFTGGCLDVAHLAVGGLEVEYFVGEAFGDVLRIAGLESTRPGLATRTPISTDSESSSAEGTTDPAAGPGVGPSASVEVPVETAEVRDRTLFSTTISLLERLDDREGLLALLEEIYLERSNFCSQYVDLLFDASRDDRALSVLERGVEQFPRNQSLRRRLADVYRDREPERHHDCLAELVVRHRDWEAYDELCEVCPEAEWPSTREKIVSRIGRSGEKELIPLYLHEGNRERALEIVLERAHLRELKTYSDRLGDIDPDAYFETYRDQIAPYLAGDTGRSHYRRVIDHLQRLRELGLDDRFESFLDDLRDEHSNRPAFLDELRKADP